MTEQIKNKENSASRESRTQKYYQKHKQAPSKPSIRSNTTVFSVSEILK